MKRKILDLRIELKVDNEGKPLIETIMYTHCSGQRRKINAFRIYIQLIK